MILSRINKYKGHLSIDELTIKSKKGSSIKREVMVRKNAVSSVVYNTITNKFIFVSQWRPGTNSDIIELVAGTIEPGEDPRNTMIREIEEEIGYKTDNITLINECYMSPGGSTEIISIYYTEVSEKISEGGGLEEEGEEIDIIEMDINDIKKTLFNDAKTIIGVNYILSNF